MQDVITKQIGYVKNDVENILNEEYYGGLKDLEEFSHVSVMGQKVSLVIPILYLIETPIVIRGLWIWTAAGKD